MARRCVDDRVSTAGLNAQVVQVVVMIDLDTGDCFELGLAGARAGGRDLVAGLEARDRDRSAVAD